MSNPKQSATANKTDDIEIDIEIRDSKWNQIKDLSVFVRRAVLAAQAQYPGHTFSEISILLTNNDHIQELNKQYRDQDKSTNVLSFSALTGFDATPLDDAILGDVVLAYDIIETEAAQANLSFAHHCTHLLIHGYLHLQGLDHETEEAATQMEAFEIKALQSLKISDPYNREDM